MADCCLIKKVATVEVYENKNEVRAYGFMAGDRNTPVMEVRFKHLWGESNLSSCKLRWIIVDDVGSLLVGEVPIQSDNTALINLPNALFTGDRRMKVQLTVASCDGERILNLQQFTDLKVINSLAPNEVVEPVYDILINKLYDETFRYLKQLDDKYVDSVTKFTELYNTNTTNFTNLYDTKYASLNGLYLNSRRSLEDYMHTAENGGNANSLQGNLPRAFSRVENTIEELINSANGKYREGDVVELLGYYTAGDGAGHKRKVEATDDGSGVQLANGLRANIVHNGEVNVSWFGVKGDAILSDVIIYDYENNTPVNCKEWGGTEFNYILEKIFNNKNINVVNFNKENYFCGKIQTIIDKNNVPISINRGDLIINGNGCNLIGGIYLECLNEDIENVTIKNMNILGRTQGFKPTTVVKEYISHEVFSTRYGYSYNGILLNPNDTTNKSIRNIFIHNCNFDTLMSGVGGGILDSPRYGISSVVVDSCTSNNLWWHGVGVRNAEFLKVTNCDFNFHVVGMMTDFSQRTRYSIMDNCSGTDVSQLCKFENGANNNIVSNCIYIKKAQNLCDAVRYVFRIAGDNNIITNCKIDATSLPDNYLNVSQIQFGTGNIIKNNDIKITQHHAIAYALIRIETSQTEGFTLDIEDNKIELINEKFNNPTSPFFQSLVILQSEISCFININNNSYKGKNIGGLLRLADSGGLSKTYRINLCNNYTTSILCHLRTKTSSDGFLNIQDNVVEFDRELGDNIVYLFNYIMKISISNNIIKNQTSNNVNGAVIQTESGNEYLNVKMDNNRFYDTNLPISLPINSAKIVDIANNIFYSKADFTVISKYATVFDIFRFSNNSIVNIGAPSKIQLTNKGFSNVDNNILNNCSLNLPSALTLEEPIV